MFYIESFYEVVKRAVLCHWLAEKTSLENVTQREENLYIKETSFTIKERTFGY